MINLVLAFYFKTWINRAFYTKSPTEEQVNNTNLAIYTYAIPNPINLPNSWISSKINLHSRIISSNSSLIEAEVYYSINEDNVTTVEVYINGSVIILEDGKYYNVPSIKLEPHQLDNYNVLCLTTNNLSNISDDHNIGFDWLDFQWRGNSSPEKGFDDSKTYLVLLGFNSNELCYVPDYVKMGRDTRFFKLLCGNIATISDKTNKIITIPSGNYAVDGVRVLSSSFEYINIPNKIDINYSDFPTTNQIGVFCDYKPNQSITIDNIHVYSIYGSIILCL